MMRFAMRISGAAAVAVGVLAIAFGSYWASQTMTFVSSNLPGALFDTFVPFLPIFLIAFGAFLFVRSRQ